MMEETNPKIKGINTLKIKNVMPIIYINVSMIKPFKVAGSMIKIEPAINFSGTLFD